MSVLGRCSGQQIFVGQQFAQRADRLDGILGITGAGAASRQQADALR